MGAYSGNYTCIPDKINYIWTPVVLLQFIIVLLGFCSHFVFVRVVVRSQTFGTYTRFTFACISGMMQVMLATSTGAFVLTLWNGKLIEDCEISALEARKILLYFHSFGEYFFVVCELLATIERVISTFSGGMRHSEKFMPVFVTGSVFGCFASLLYIYFVRISFNKTLFLLGFGSLTLMEVMNGLIVFLLWYVAKKKYLERKDTSLTRRYEFSRSYAYCRCAAASVTARVFIITYIYLKLVGLFDGDLDSAFFYIMNLFINFYCLVYPWTIMCCHRKIYSQIRVYLNQKIDLLRSQKVKQEGEKKNLYTIDGKQMNNMSSEEHFVQLSQFWNSGRNT